MQLGLNAIRVKRTGVLGELRMFYFCLPNSIQNNFRSSCVTLANYNVKFIDIFWGDVDCSKEPKFIGPVKKLFILLEITWKDHI